MTERDCNGGALGSSCECETAGDCPLTPAADPILPFALWIPTALGKVNDGTLNHGTAYEEVPVVLDPAMELRGECRQGYGGPVIALREWNEQVFLHEVLHVATGWCQPPLATSYPPNGHEVIARANTAGWNDGYKFALDNISDPMVYADLNEYGAGWAGLIANGGLSIDCEDDGAA